MPYVIRKNPWLGAILVVLLGPLGFLYYSWRKALVVFFLFFIPNLVLHNLNDTAAAVLAWTVHFLLAIFAYLDIADKLYLFEEWAAKCMGVASLPLMFMNAIGGIAGGIWMLFLGQWKIVFGAIFFSFFVPNIYALLNLLQLPLLAVIAYAENTRKKGLGMATGFLTLLIGHGIMLAYMMGVLDFCTSLATKNDLNIVAVLMFGYGVATTPFSYMASQEPRGNNGSMFGVFLVQMSYLILSIAYLMDNPRVGLLLVLMCTFAIEALQMYLADSEWDLQGA